MKNSLLRAKSFARPAWMMATAFFLLCSSVALASQELDKPILIIGASGDNGQTPINDNLVGPFGGYCVNSGSYLSLGDALLREKELPGFVINEAVAGATTFARKQCIPGQDTCLDVGWQGFDVQFQKALTRVPGPGGYNADYVVIGGANDCLHPGAFGIPQDQTSPCSEEELNAVVDRYAEIGRMALEVGITPIYTMLPKYEDLDLPLFQQAFGFSWVIGEEDFNTLRDLHRSRLEDELPEALVVEVWTDFQHIGDGIHQDPESSENAAKIIAKAIRDHQKSIVE